tara:strand:+ start:2548 stop:3717 length:1170 start_codon:yes stop_codon:yes gene_type:complete
MTNLESKYPRILDMVNKAKSKIPYFCSEYLFSGTGKDDVVEYNSNIFKDIFICPKYLKGTIEANTSTNILNFNFDAPFGVAPVGSGGIIWPGAESALAKMSNEKNIPYCLSAVACSSIEEISPISKNNGWFQLYPPKDKNIRDDILDRVNKNKFSVLVVTVDIPATSRRERVKKAGVSIPPKLSYKTITQAMAKPHWAMATLANGWPNFFGTMNKYEFYKKDLLNENWNEMPRFVDWDYISEIKEKWKGPIILKGIMHEEDAFKASKVVDGIILSNHGGRQIDIVPSPMQVLPKIRSLVGNDFPILIDSGFYSGQDIVKALVLGADFILLGRAFMIGLAALGAKGPNHVHYILQDEIKNIMEQLCCSSIAELKKETVYLGKNFHIKNFK